MKILQQVLNKRRICTGTKAGGMQQMNLATGPSPIQVMESARVSLHVTLARFDEVRRRVSGCGSRTQSIRFDDMIFFENGYLL